MNPAHLVATHVVDAYGGPILANSFRRDPANEHIMAFLSVVEDQRALVDETRRMQPGASMYVAQRQCARLCEADCGIDQPHAVHGPDAQSCDGCLALPGEPCSMDCLSRVTDADHKDTV